MTQRTAPPLTQGTNRYQRIGQRRRIRIPGRLMWRDSSGTQRFAPVITRDVSELDAFVECQVPTSIPLYRLVYLQLDTAARSNPQLPAALRAGQGKVLSAIYRVGPYRSATGTPQGYAIRLLVEPLTESARVAATDIAANQ